MTKCILFLMTLLVGYQSLNAYEYEIAISSMFRNCAPYIREWVVYHHMIGVEHFWLYDDDSEDNWKEQLQDFIDAGIVETFHWPVVPAENRPQAGFYWGAQQVAAFRDSLKRAMGVAKWVSLLDQDEFILPMQNESLKECLDNHFSDAAEVYMSWRNFGTSHKKLSFGESMLSTLTSSSMRSHSNNAAGKSIMRPECLDMPKFWSQHFCSLKPGCKMVDGDAEETLEFPGDGVNLNTSGFHHDRFIRINHYAHRDENYFFDYRLPRDENRKLMLEHYESYNLVKDFKIINYIKNRYPDHYLKYWKKD